jgi:hypothetical protein
VPEWEVWRVRSQFGLGTMSLTPDAHSKGSQHGPEDKLAGSVLLHERTDVTTLTPTYTSAAASKKPTHEKAPEKTAPISLSFLHICQTMLVLLFEGDVLFLEDSVGDGFVASTKDTADQNLVVEYLYSWRASI